MTGRTEAKYIIDFGGETLRDYSQDLNVDGTIILK
jgi:hypothetical protein